MNVLALRSGKSLKQSVGDLRVVYDVDLHFFFHSLMMPSAATLANSQNVTIKSMSCKRRIQLMLTLPESKSLPERSCLRSQDPLPRTLPTDRLSKPALDVPKVTLSKL